MSKETSKVGGIKSSSSSGSTGSLRGAGGSGSSQGLSGRSESSGRNASAGTGSSRESGITSSTTSARSTLKDAIKERQDQRSDSKPGAEDKVQLSDEAASIAAEEKSKLSPDQIVSNEAATPTEKSGEVHPPDFNKMTQQEQGEYLESVVKQQAEQNGIDPETAWKDGEGEVNLIGIRSFEDGQPVEQRPNEYDDSIYAVWKDGEGNYNVESYKSSVDAGVWTDQQRQEHDAGKNYSLGDYQDGKFNGILHMADGVYTDTYTKGTHGDLGFALKQNGAVNVHADSSGDAVIQDNEKLGENGEGRPSTGGLNIHKGGSGDQVNTWSAGCQVIHESDYQKFKDTMQNAPNDTFTYTLIDSSKLPPVGASQGYQSPAAGSPPAVAANYDKDSAMPYHSPSQAASAADNNAATAETSRTETGYDLASAVPHANPVPAPQNPIETPAASNPVQPQETAAAVSNNVPAHTAPAFAAPQLENAFEANPNQQAGALNNMGAHNPTSAGQASQAANQNPHGAEGIGQQFMMITMAAMQEVGQGIKNGPAVQTLAQWMQMAQTSQIPLPPNVRNMAAGVLQQASG